MIACDFCVLFEQGGTCGLGLKLPKKMSCREFRPTLKSFCSEPGDFVDPRQIVQMATYFGIKGMELKKVKLMAVEEESNRVNQTVLLNAAARSALAD